MSKAVFLDRDGVINEIVVRDGSLSAPYALSEFVLLPGAARAVSLLKEAGFKCLLVTNQPGISRGKLSVEVVDAIDRILREEIGLDGIYYCPHEVDRGCGCCKPQPGMIRAAVAKYDLDLFRSFVVGDRWRDMDLAVAVGCRRVLIPSLATFMDGKVLSADFTAADLCGAAEWIVGRD